MLKLVFYGHSGCGKSTATRIAKEYYEGSGRTVAVLKIAYPLYQFQHSFYHFANRVISFYDQDQVLLEIIAQQLRRISPTCLADDFLRRLAACTSDLVINDDLRDVEVDYPALKANGFRFVRITCREEIRRQRLRNRGDITVALRSPSSTRLDEIVSDVVIDNSGCDITELPQKVSKALRQLA